MIIPRVSQLMSDTGRALTNQYVIQMPEGEWFQSCSTPMAFKSRTNPAILAVNLDYFYAIMSDSTSRALSMFLGMGIREIALAIKRGDIIDIRAQELETGEVPPCN